MAGAKLMTTFSAYIDHFQYQRSPSGLESASLIGNSMRLSGAVVIGATTLPVAQNILVALNANDRITIFDGLNSEVVIVASAATVGASSITIQSPGFVANHAQYTPCCSDGILGSLADEIVNASDWLENICQQSLLYNGTATTETLRMPSMRASIDNGNILTIRPRNFPIGALNSLAIKSNNSVSTSYDATQAIIEATGQSISVPWLIGGSGGGSTYSLTTQVSRQSTQWLTINYNKGYTLATLPGSVKDACVLLTSDILARRQNTTGADSIIIGKKSMVTSARGDTSAMSGLLKAAMRQLQSYVAEAY
jgi:hypothetical protein